MTPPAVVAGVGATRWTRRSAESEQALAQRAILAALRDAGLRPADVDGLVRYDRAAVWEFDLPGVRTIGRMGFYNAVPFASGSAPALLRMAAMGVASGRAEVVVAYHARNPAERTSGSAATLVGDEQFQVPFGVTAPEHALAIVVRAWMTRHRVPERVIAATTIRLRRQAGRNPRALSRRPLTLAAHQRSPFLAEPLRVVDCAPPAAGAAAFVVTTAARAGGRGVGIVGSMQLGLPNVQRQLADWFRADRVPPTIAAARAMYRAARLRPGLIDVAYFQDLVSPMVLLGLEHFGFCRRGGAGAMILEGARRPRVNPTGGAIGEGQLDGINHLLDAVRQVRGDSPVQVRGARTALVAGSPLEPTSAVLLRRMG